MPQDRRTRRRQQEGGADFLKNRRRRKGYDKHTTICPEQDKWEKIRGTQIAHRNQLKSSRKSTAYYFSLDHFLESFVRCGKWQRSNYEEHPRMQRRSHRTMARNRILMERQQPQKKCWKSSEYNCDYQWARCLRNWGILFFRAFLV